MKKVRSNQASISINSSTDLAYSSSENFLPPIPASDWFNILLRKCDISSKKRNENDKKHKFFDEKQQKDTKKYM